MEGSVFHLSSALLVLSVKLYNRLSLRYELAHVFLSRNFSFAKCEHFGGEKGFSPQTTTVPRALASHFDDTVICCSKPSIQRSFMGHIH